MTPTDERARAWAEHEYDATLARAMDVTGAVRDEARRVRVAAEKLAGCGPRLQITQAALSEDAARLDEMAAGDPERRFHAQRRGQTYYVINELGAAGDSIETAIWRLVRAAIGTWPARLKREERRYRAAMTRRLFGQSKSSDANSRLAERLRRRYFTEDKAAKQ